MHLFEVQTRRCVESALELINMLLHQEPTKARDDLIRDQAAIIRELLRLADFEKYWNQPAEGDGDGMRVTPHPQR
jgi:hypothetical protein